MHLFDNLDSGNGYKVRLLLAQLGISYQWTNLDLDRGDTRKPGFLKRNPNGRIPTLELDDGTNLAESNAILWYLAEGTQFVPNDRVCRAQVLQWMFFSAPTSPCGHASVHREASRRRAPAGRSCLERLAKGRAALARSWTAISPSIGSSWRSNTPSPTSRSTPTRGGRGRARLSPYSHINVAAASGRNRVT
jgi:glutathione S-transferase